MADQIATFYRTAYTDFIRLKAMTLESAFRKTVDFEPSRGEFLILYSYGQPALAAEITTRNQQTDAIANPDAIAVPRTARRVAPRHWEHSELFDPRDRVKLLRDIRPDSNWSKAVLGAFAKQIDVLLAVASDADATDSAGGALTFNTNETTGSQIAHTVGANSGMNVDKIIQAVSRLRKLRALVAGVNVPVFGWLDPIHVEQLFSFTNDDRLLSGDFNTMRPLQSGMVGSYHGVDFVVGNDIVAETIESAAGHYAYIGTKDSMVFTMDGNIEVHFDILPEHRHALQVAHYATFSTTRMHEEKIIRIENHDVAV